MQRTLLPLCLVVLVLGGTAFGFGPTVHNATAVAELSNTWVAPTMYAIGLNPTTVGNRSYLADLPSNNTWEQPQWEGGILSRGYVYDAKWGQLSEADRISFLMHVSTDVGMPCGHSPARPYWNSYENTLEARAETWTSVPGISSYYTGTIANQRSQFSSDCIANAQWGAANVTSTWEASFGADGRTVMWNGMIYGEKMSVAVILDYFRAKMPTVAEANGGYSVSPGGSVTFSSANSYDPDEVSTNANGSASQTWTGLTRSWDLNDDGVFETSGASPTLTYAQLQALGLGVGSHTARLRCQDNEGSTYLDQYNNGGVSYDTASFYMYGSGLMAAAVPEPSSIAMLLAMAISLGLWKIRRN